MLVNLRAISAAAFLIVAGFASTARADVEHPFGTQTFESMDVGDDINTLVPWFSVNTPPESPFTVVAADDVLGTPTTRDGSTRWLRVTDQDAGNVQNRFYSGAVISPAVANYTWVFYVNLEMTPPGGTDTKPKLVIQHNNSPFANAWGIEFTSTGANLIVLGIGGAPASTPLYPLASPTGVGDWVKLLLYVDFDNNMVSASANGGPSVSLPINLAATADKKVHRFCFRGEGTGNASKLLVDDVSVVVGEIGACCDGTSGVCTDGVAESECTGDQQVWSLGEVCGSLDPSCTEHTGACCERVSGDCADGVPGSACDGSQQTWTKGGTCAAVVCDAATGACCNDDPFGGCIDGRTLAECGCSTCEWSKGQECADVTCELQSIPAVGEWGLLVLALLLLIVGKVAFGSGLRAARRQSA